MKKMGSGLRRLIWWGALAIFVFCGAWTAYYLYSAVVGSQTLGDMSGRIAALRDAPSLPGAPVATAVPADAQATMQVAGPAAMQADMPAQEKPSAPLPYALAEQVTPAPLNTVLPGGTANQGLWGQDASGKPVAATPEASFSPGVQDALLAYYQGLATENQELIGWIAIEDTVVDYPVMYTPDDPQKYLHRDFEGRYSFSGVPFLDAGCDPYEPSSNLIVYAHNMRSGQMFAEVTKYLDPDFLKAHPTVMFDTLSQRGSYEVIAVFTIDLKPLDDPSMLCYSPFSTITQEAVDALNQYIVQYAAVQAGQAQAGDRILTLSTCRRVGSTDRLVVMGRAPGKE